MIPGEGQIGFTDFYWTAPQTLLLPGGSKISLRYDQFLQVKERLLTDPAETELAKALYEYELENNITQIDHQYGVMNFNYDNLYRLSDADYPWSQADNPSLKTDESFDYDGVGNRTSEGPGSATELDAAQQAAQTTSFTYDNQNRLTANSDNTTFTHNTNGHTTQKVHGGVTTDYIYNREERLIEVRTNGATTGQYAYNPYGQRIRKIANGQTTWFLYNPEGLAAEYDNSGTLIKEYHFKPNSPWMTQPLIQRTASGDVYYFQNDHLGTPQRLVNKTGKVVWEARYEAFGKAEVVVGDVENNLRFPGQYFDAENGLHQNYMRDYDPSLGRYVQSDPIGMMGGINFYIYSIQNPLIYSDPTGEFINPAGVAFGVAGELGGQLFKHIKKYGFTTDCLNIDGLDVIAAGFFGGLFPGGGAVWKSRKSYQAKKVLQKQFDRTKSDSWKKKLMPRIDNHQSIVADAVGGFAFGQIGKAATKYLADDPNYDSPRGDGTSCLKKCG